MNCVIGWCEKSFLGVSFATLDTRGKSMQKTIEVSQYEQERGKPMPSKLHGHIQFNLGLYLGVSYSERFSFFSELSLQLNAWDSVPDISIFPKMEFDYSQDETKVTEPPLCAIEILSPSQSMQELISKARKYFDYGVKSCWLVIPSVKNIYVFSSPNDYQIFRDTQTLHDPVIEVRLELSKVFS
jgi:Uma2 family endonuclease